MNAKHGDILERFLRKESFYIAVLLLVVALGAIQTFRQLSPGTETSELPTLMTYQEYRQFTFRRSLALTPEEAEACAAYLTARSLMLGTLVAGIFAAVLLAIVWLSWGFKPATPLDPVPWGLWDVLKVAAVYAAGAQMFHWVLPGNPYHPFLHVYDWLAEAFSRVLLIGTVLYVALSERQGRPDGLGIRGPVGRALLIGALGFLVLQAPLRGIESFMLRGIDPWPMQTPLQALLQTDSSATLITSCVVAIVLTPITEELFFRGFLQPALQRWVGPGYAIFLSAAFFAVAHMDVYAIPTMLVMGIGLGYVYHRTRSLIAPVLLHAAHNGLLLLLLLSSRGLFSLGAH
jgi:hypothetical protein